MRTRACLHMSAYTCLPTHDCVDCRWCAQPWRSDSWHHTHLLSPLRCRGHGWCARCRECNCRTQMGTRQISPGRHQYVRQRVCDQCPNIKLTMEWSELDVEIEPGMRDGHEIIFHGDGEPHIGLSPALTSSLTQACSQQRPHPRLLCRFI